MGREDFLNESSTDEYENKWEESILQNSIHISTGFMQEANFRALQNAWGQLQGLAPTTSVQALRGLFSLKIHTQTLLILIGAKQSHPEENVALSWSPYYTPQKIQCEKRESVRQAISFFKRKQSFLLVKKYFQPPPKQNKTKLNRH